MTISSSKQRKIRKSKTNAYYLAQAGARVISDNLCVQSSKAMIERPNRRKTFRNAAKVDDCLYHKRKGETSLLLSS